ncbi:MAG: dihydroorotase [Flavobacteriales bacterium]
MKTLLRKVTIHYPGHKLNGKTVDFLLSGSKIEQIGAHIKAEKANEVKGQQLICMPGLIDLQCTVGEPGHEYKEDLKSASAAAEAGGFKTIVMTSSTEPVIDNKAQLQFIANHSKNLKTNILAYGAITKGAEGKELSEMFDMHSSLAVAFSDGKRPVKDVNMMKRALEYVKNFNGLVCSFPLDERLNPGAMVHESESNTLLGIKQMPDLAEEIMLNRDLYLLEYTNSRMHVSTVSCEGSVKLLSEAKRKKLNVTSGVALANLIYTDKALQGFDSVYKVNPPLRESADRKALIKGLKNGSIDVIVTDHTPENIENKDREFDHAAYGMTMLETALSLINMELSQDLDWEDIAKLMSLNPRAIIGMKDPKLEEGSSFDFTVFDTKVKWVYDKKTCKSKSHNSPMFGKELIGKVVEF